MMHASLILDGKVVARRKYEFPPQRGDIIQIESDAYIVCRTVWVDPERDDRRDALQIEHIAPMKAVLEDINNALEKVASVEEQKA